MCTVLQRKEKLNQPAEKRQSGVNQTVKLRRKCNGATPYWRCLIASHGQTDTSGGICLRTRGLLHTPLLERTSACFVPVAADPETLSCRTPLPRSLQGRGSQLPRIRSLLLPESPSDQVDKRGNAPGLPLLAPTSRWGSCQGAEHKPTPHLPTTPAVGSPPGCGRAPLPPACTEAVGQPVPSPAASQVHETQTAPREVLSLSSGTEQTDPAQLLPDCHSG